MTVNAVNDTPTLDALSNLSIAEDAAQQTVNLAGITAGGGESQPQRVTASSSSTGLIPNPTVTYTSANPMGSLAFTPVTDQSGTATITVTVEDGGLDNNLSTAGDNATFSRTFDVTVNPLDDFGDAPAPYPTTLAEDGARHSDVGPRLGATRDEESDGLHSAAADADGSDEDGVLDTGGFLVVGDTGASVTINVQNASGGAKLDAWMDFNQDGDWDDAGEQILTDTAVINGDNPLTFSVPSSASVGTTYARVRLSTAGGLAVTGSAADGEVEDYEIEISAQADFGDAPSTYPVTRSENGARHTLTGPMLGATRDAEVDGLHSAAADADGSDEDGVLDTGGFLVVGDTGASVTINVQNASGGAKLDAWMDFNQDGDWGRCRGTDPDRHGGHQR